MYWGPSREYAVPSNGSIKLEKVPAQPDHTATCLKIFCHWRVWHKDRTARHGTRHAVSEGSLIHCEPFRRAHKSEARHQPSHKSNGTRTPTNQYVPPQAYPVIYAMHPKKRSVAQHASDENGTTRAGKEAIVAIPDRKEKNQDIIRKESFGRDHGRIRSVYTSWGLLFAPIEPTESRCPLREVAEGLRSGTMAHLLMCQRMKSLFGKSFVLDLI